LNAFNWTDELKRLREQTKTIRKLRYRKSRLDRYAGELLQLKNGGASIAELKRFLTSKRIKVCHSTVSRWIKENGKIRECSKAIDVSNEVVAESRLKECRDSPELRASIDASSGIREI